jgi:hypothetical protein
MPLRAIEQQHPQSQAADNMEVVVSVHAAWTTTSEAKQAGFGVITLPKRELITSEKEPASTTLQLT